MKYGYFRKTVASVCAASLLITGISPIGLDSLTVSAAIVDNNGDSYTRSLSIITDMVHDNPGGNPYVTQYDDVDFLAERGLTGKVFFLSESAHLAIDWQDYDANIFPVGSAGYNWVQQKKEEYRAKYQEAKDAGLKVYFMMDFISLPNSMKTLYGDEILTNGKIDINKPKTKEIMAEMMRELFEEFPEIDGIYPRYGESYVGYYSGYHFGNNPIAVSDTKANDHATLLQFFRDEVCEKLDKEIVYRTWSTEVGENSFTTSKSLYLEITNQVEPHENLYIAIKHTAGDFWRNYTFNETIGIGNHKQIIEIQCAREYEGKGAFPNYIAGSVINGFPEYEWQMSADANQSLRDVVNCENSIIEGIWTWSRGGGWGGPYINGTEVPEGDELWCDLNAYVLHQWAQDTSRTDTSLVKQYAMEVLGMNETDAENFVRFAELSSEAVLYGIGTDCAPTWDALWTRDASTQSSNFSSNLMVMYNTGENGEFPKLNERRQAVANYNEMLEIAEGFSDSVAAKEYIQLTTKYGWYLFSIWERMWTAGVLFMDRNYNNLQNADEINAVIDEFYDLWDGWEQLKEENTACPTLYTKSMCTSIIDQYRCSDEPWVDDRPDGPDKNYALNSTASSKYVDSHFPILAVDGDMSTRWGTPSSQSDRASQWFMVDLGEAKEIDTVVLYWESTISCPSEYKIQISNDGETFTDVYHETNGQGGTETVTFDKISARYVRMQGIKEKGKYGYSLYEFEVYNKSLNPDRVVIPGDNLAVNKSTSASYQHNAFAPSYVTDGDNDNTDKDTSKRWNAGNIASTECWITVDLGASTDINMVKLYWNMKNCPTGYDIQLSTDALTWTTVDSYTGGLINSNSTDSYILTHEFDTVNARFVRVYVSAENRTSDTGNWVSLVEFEVYNATILEGFVKGDVNGDRVLGAADLTTLARYIAGIGDLAYQELEMNADMNGDGDVTSADLTELAAVVSKIV